VGLGTRVDFDRVRSWARIHLDRLENQLDNVTNRIIGLNDFDLVEKCVVINSNPNQKFKSKLDMEQSYVNCMNDLREKFIQGYLFTEYTVPTINTVDSTNSVGGFYDQNTFYLNTNFWETNPRSDIKSLVLHEVIPGHHLQSEYSNRSDMGLLSVIYEIRFSGYVEGWGLFAEELQELNSDYDWYGYLQSQILRTYRIIGEIDLHVKNITIDKVILDAQSHLVMDDVSIEAEVYRWAMFPGQASSYKIGAEVFKNVIKKKFCTDSSDFVRPDMIEFYKDLLGSGEKTLGIILNETNTEFSF
jgi:uncharacterized protein (DUF885 family)